ncbi:hypothetical protein B296_00012357 [Ensete ventricosum]|uniref:Uncharacterized protein n=1 Tax=Ensete ventricosum TaxID=4639 RepID=A0A426ZX63_ENSVE|nr:hypothetical protein B296_00012357 [Ensete ventricosum]
MRLNRVESFYAFLLHFRSKHSKEEDGRPTMARPYAGALAMAWPLAKGWLVVVKGRLAVAKAPCTGAAGCRQLVGVAGCRATPVRGCLPAARP